MQQAPIVEPAKMAAGIQSIASRLRGGAVWLIGSRLLGTVVGVVTQMIVARALSPADFGNFALLASVITFGCFLAMMGSSAAVIRYVPESLQLGRPRRAARFLRWALALAGRGALLVGGATLLFWPWLARWMKVPEDRWLAVIVALSIVALAFLQLLAEALRGFHELRFASVLSGGQKGGFAASVIFLLLLAAAVFWTRPGLQSVMALNLSAILLVIPVAAVALVGTARARLAGAEDASGGAADLRTGEILRVCLVLMAIQCVTFLSTQADLWIANACCSKDDLGLYSAARRLMLIIVMPVQMGNYLVAGSIAGLLAHGQRRQLEKLLRTVVTLFAIPSVLGLIAVLVLSEHLLGIIFGDFYRRAAQLLVLLSAGQLMLVVAGSCHSALLMAGHQTKALAVNGITASMTVVGGWIAARLFGIAGLAVTCSVIVALESLVLLLLARRYVGVWTHINPRINWASLLAASSGGLMPDATPDVEEDEENAPGADSTAERAP